MQIILHANILMEKNMEQKFLNDFADGSFLTYNKHDAEYNIIGSMILCEYFYASACSKLSKYHFDTKILRVIFIAIMDAFNNGVKKLNVKMVFHFIPKKYRVVEGTEITIKSINDIVVNSEYIYSNELLKNLILRRNEDVFRKQLLEADLNAIKFGVEESSSMLMSKIIESNSKNTKSSMFTFNEIMFGSMNMVEKIDFNRNNPNSLKKLSTNTGFRHLDAMIGGLKQSNLVILAARPSVGKTALAMNLAVNVARRGSAVGFISLEMSVDQLAMRLLSADSGIPSFNIESGNINDNDYKLVFNSAHSLSTLCVVIEEGSMMTIESVIMSAKKMKYTHKIDVLIIDYMQLLSVSKYSYGGNRQNEISTISRQIKALARELSISIVCLSQLSRKTEERDDKRPRLSDLRDSGSIEQDADQVLLMYRESYYSKTTNEDEIVDPYKAEIIIAKNRHGRTGSIKLRFKPDILKFSNIDKININKVKIYKLVEDYGRKVSLYNKCKTIIDNPLLDNKKPIYIIRTINELRFNKILKIFIRLRLIKRYYVLIINNEI